MRWLPLLLLIAGCGPEAPYIRELVYSPNAAFTGEEQEISGRYLYSDPDHDISQSVVEVVDPMNNLIYRSPPTPIENVGGTEPTGQVDFSFPLTAPTAGIYHFNTWIIDLIGLKSNKLRGAIRVSDKTPAP